MKPKKTRTSGSRSVSAVELAREAPVTLRCMLWGLAGGRCEFRGCPKLLLEHKVTALEVNLAQVAHVVAFSPDGPRGRGRRPKNVHALENLMLLCTDCHTLIDQRPEDFSREMLRAYKKVHEDRIRHLTGLSPDMSTTVVQLKSHVAGRAVDIPVSHVYEAVLPRWPSDRDGHVIDLSGINVETEIGTQSAAERIDAEVKGLYRPGMDAERTRHISLFALAPIPLLVHLGARLSDKIPVSFFQRHRDSNRTPWAWRDDQPAIDFKTSVQQRGTSVGKVAVLFSVSGPINRTALPSAVDAGFTIYEVTPLGSPGVGLLNNRETLERFRVQYRALVNGIMTDHPGLAELHVFAAVPAPVAVTIGHDLLPKVHPDLIVYDNIRTEGGFVFRLRVAPNAWKI